MKSFVRKLLGPLLLATTVFPASRSSAAVDMFLKLADSRGTILIQGESLDKQHPDEIVLSSFSQGVSVPISNPVGGGGTGAGKASFSELSVAKLLDKASPLLYSYAAQGRRIPTVVLTVRKSGEKPVEFYRITLTDVLISSVQTGGGGDVPSESLSLNFTKIEWRYTPQKADGSPDAPVIATWDLAANKP